MNIPVNEYDPFATKDELFDYLILHGITVRADMTGPRDVINGRAITARSIKLSKPSQLLDYLASVSATNFALYKKHGPVIRFGCW